MLKRIGRKAISWLLAFVLIATTFFIFDPSIPVIKSGAVVDVKKLESTVEPTVKFLVPETIYLHPVIDESKDQKYSFQYFVDSDENGTLHRSATQTTGTVFFSCSSLCSSISIEWENSTVSANDVQKTGQILKQTITGGTTSVSDGRVKVTCTYVVGDVTYKAYAYTYMYYPDLDLLTGTGGTYVYKPTLGNNPKLSAFAFITGVHYVGNKGTYDDDRLIGGNNYYDQYSTSSSKGVYGVSPLVPGWANVWEGNKLVTGPAGAEFKTADDDANVYDRENLYAEKTSDSKFIESGDGGVVFRNRERSGDTSRIMSSADNNWGTLIVDKSRTTNFNQIPNLRGGYIIHFYASCSDEGKLDEFRSTDSAITVSSNIGFKNGDGKGYGMSESDALSGEIPSSDTNYTMEAHFRYERDNSSGVNNYYRFGLRVKTVSKASLRSTYRDSIEEGWQADTAERGHWSDSAKSQWTSAYNSFISALDQAGTILGKPYANATEISDAVATLDAARNSCSALIKDNFKADSGSESTNRVKFIVPETIYLNPDNGTAFQYIYGTDENGNPTKDVALSSATSARIYFTGTNCSPKNVKITCEASSADNNNTWSNTSSGVINSITYGGTSLNGSQASGTGISSSSFPVDTTCSGGSLNQAVASGSTRFIRWRADYVVDGVTYTAFAYSTLYRHPNYTISFRQSSRKKTSWKHRPAFINGKFFVYGLNYEQFDEAQGSEDGGSKSDNNNNNSKTRETSYIVDSSRFTNYNKLPYFSSKSEMIDNRNDGVVDVKAYNSSDSSKTVSIGTSTTTINLPITNSTLVIYMHAHAVYRSNTAQNYSYLNITPTLVNKSSLRDKYYSAVADNLQQSMYSSGYDAYQNSLVDMAVKIGNPAGTSTSGAADTGNLVRNSGAVKATYYRDPNAIADFNGEKGAQIIGTETDTKYYSYGDTAYGFYSNIPGFTAKRYSVSYGDITKTDGVSQDSSHNNYFYVKNVTAPTVEWSFYYTPNTYTATYDPNGGTYNGTGGSSSTSITFQSRFTVGNIDNALPDNPTRTGYTFIGWKCDVDGITYQPGDQINWEYAENTTYTALWKPLSYTITFMSDNTVLQSSKWNYDETPVYNGTPSKASDDQYEYKFIGWDPEIKPVTGDATYTAQFEPVAHTFKYVSIDSKQHKLVCDNCKYEGAVSDHNIVKDEKTGYYKCTECDYFVAKYSVKVNGAEVPLTLRPEMTTEFLVATITYQNAAKPNKDGKYFVYWKDTDTGEIISAYTTYSFFVTRNYNIVPVFATQQEYYTKRAEATVVARMTGIKDNENGSYSLLAEHSVSSSAGPINNHGILYTYDASLKDSLDMDNVDTNGISRATASSTSTTLTGLFNVKLSKDKHSAIYARPYICFVDNEGKISYKYGEVKEYSLADISTQAAESDVLSTDSYDLSDISAEEPVTPTEPTEKNPLEKIADFFAKLVEIIKTILSFFGLTGVAR